MMDIIVFNVEMGQCLFLYPRKSPQHARMIDCGNRSDFEPINQIIKWNFLSPGPTNGNLTLPNLTITNYDHDHFGGLPYLRSKADIYTVNLARNLSIDELKSCKPVETKALREVCNLLERYTGGSPKDWNPPYSTRCFSLNKAHFPDGTHDTNRLSQLVFVSYCGSTICVPGDLDRKAWEIHLKNEQVTQLLAATNIFVASHHGREDGYNEAVFDHCSPECVILSDKHVCHGTQDGMCGVYRSKVKGAGFVLNGDTNKLRRTLTTRCDGHLWIQIQDDGGRIYRTLTLN